MPTMKNAFISVALKVFVPLDDMLAWLRAGPKKIQTGGNDYTVISFISYPLLIIKDLFKPAKIICFKRH